MLVQAAPFCKPTHHSADLGQSETFHEDSGHEKQTASYHILLGESSRNTTFCWNKGQNHLILGTFYQYPAGQQAILPRPLPPIPVSTPSL